MRIISYEIKRKDTLKYVITEILGEYAKPENKVQDLVRSFLIRTHIDFIPKIISIDKACFIKPKHTCYVCLEEDENTTRPCDTCNYRVHIECGKNLDACGCCRSKYYWGCYGIFRPIMNEPDLS
jgi:hypothetical protein